MLEKIGHVVSMIAQVGARVIRLCGPLGIQVTVLLIALNQALGGIRLGDFWMFRTDFVVLRLHQILPDWAERLVMPTVPAAARLYWGLLGLVVIAVWVSRLALWKRGPKVMRVRTSEGQTIHIYRGALLKFVRSIVRSHPAVQRFRVTVRSSLRNSINVEVRLSARPIASIHAITAQIERAIREGFRRLMGIEKIGTVEIKITHIDQKGLARERVRTLTALPGPPPRAETETGGRAGTKDDGVVTFGEEQQEAAVPPTESPLEEPESDETPPAQEEQPDEAFEEEAHGEADEEKPAGTRDEQPHAAPTPPSATAGSAEDAIQLDTEEEDLDALRFGQITRETNTDRTS